MAQEVHTWASIISLKTRWLASFVIHLWHLISLFSYDGEGLVQRKYHVVNMLNYGDFTVLKIHLWCTFEQPPSKMYSSNVALPKLLIEKGLITQAEFTKQLSTDRAVYQAMLGKMR